MASETKRHRLALAGIEPGTLRRWVRGLRCFRLVRATPLMAANDGDRFMLAFPVDDVPAHLPTTPGRHELHGGPVFVSQRLSRLEVEVFEDYVLTEADFERARAIEATLPADVSLIDPPADHGLCITPELYPEVFAES